MNGTQIIIAIIILAAMGILVYGVVSTRRKQPSASRVTPGSASVTFDEELIRCEAGSKTMQLRWDALIGVAIETTDQGPFIDDMFYILAGENDTVVCPSEAKGAQGLLTRLQQLPDFNNEAVIAAMTSTSNQTFICWDKKGRHNKAIDDD